MKVMFPSGAVASLSGHSPKPTRKKFIHGMFPAITLSLGSCPGATYALTFRYTTKAGITKDYFYGPYKTEADAIDDILRYGGGLDEEPYGGFFYNPAIRPNLIYVSFP